MRCRFSAAVIALTFAALLLAMLAAACGSENKTASTAAPTSPPATSTAAPPTPVPTIAPTHGPPQTVAVDVTDKGFSPNQLVVNVGDTVVWTNSGTATRWIVEDKKTLFNSGLLFPGQSYSFTFQQPGGFTYHCEIATWMVGSVTVQ